MNETNKKCVPGAAAVTGILALMALAVVVTLLLVKLLWAWTIPDLFPGAVKQGLIASSLSWLSAFKLALFLGVIIGIAKGKNGS